MLHVTWSAQASEDLGNIISYIADRNASAAAGLDALIHETVDRVENFPYMGRSGRVDDTRFRIVYMTVHLTRSLG